MSRHLEVNPIACDGRGLCAELLPELIGLDDWGYPMLAPGSIPAGLEAHVRRAVAACPRLALRVRERPDPPPAARGTRRRSG
jgi:ferredoxin